jgi:large subunit ribosomal protein L31
MKAKIHPQWYSEAKVTCSCGHTFTVGSTQPELKVQICSHCHPFFTGEMRYVDEAGRVEKFQAKMESIAGKKYVKKKERKRLKWLEEKRAEEKRPKSLKEMLHSKS